MAQWGKNDAASNSVIWAADQLKVKANTANRDALFGNTTANATIAGVTVGVYAVDDSEIAAGGGKVAHTGWVIQTTGQGGRAGRVMTEVLVAGGMAGDAEDVAFPDYRIRITTQPVNRTASASNNDVASFSVVASSVPAGANLAYAWTYANGDSIGAETANATSSTLAIAANAATTGVAYKVTVSTAGAVNVVSSNATITITT